MKRWIVAFFVLLIAMAISNTAFASMQKEKPAKKAIVLAVFGTSYTKTLKSILNLQQKMEKAFPEIPVHLAFTSQIIRGKWAQRAFDEKWRKEHPEVPDYVYEIKNPLATIANLQDQGYQYIAIQSTHIFAGEEYHNLKAVVQALDNIRTLRERDKPFKKLILGRPALGEPGDVYPYMEDIQRAAKAVKGDVDFARKNRSALVYMGHGNEIYSTGAYIEFQEALRDAHPNVPIFVGTVEGFPGPKRVLNSLKRAGEKKVILMPLMVVAGDHAANDMAGDEEDSWKSIFEKAGIAVEPVLRGLGELDAWGDIYVQNLKDAMSGANF